MASRGGDVTIGVQFQANQASLQNLVKPLQEVQKIASSKLTMGDEFKKALTTAQELQKIISGSWNAKLNQLNLNTFQKGLKDAGLSAKNVQQALTAIGPAGQTAFNNISHSILNTNIQLKQSKTILDDMAESMGNTVKWGITSGIFNKMTGAIQSAFYYAKDLNLALTDIRMVTGASAEEMDKFAQNANKVSTTLARSTLDYTKAAVGYYRQGLGDEQVARRTEVTLKAQNITGSGAEMQEYLTAVWNGFKATNDEIERFADSMALVADSSASDMSELATAMSKVAATAETVGVSFDQLNAQIATVVSATRLAPESVGTAFKTVYSRINDIKTGADEAEISLGNYSGKMAELGFNVLDASGNLRDTGQVIEEIGGRWSTLTKEQQTYLASLMGGQRQITQVMALFNNWDKYVDLLNKSLSANGTLNDKNNTYLESTKAHMEQLSATAERLYATLSDTGALNGLIDTLKGGLSIVTDFVAGIGGGVTALVNFGSMVANLFNKQITTGIQRAIESIERFKNNKALTAVPGQWSEEAQNQSAAYHMQRGDVVSAEALQQEAALTEKTLQLRKYLTTQQYQEMQELQRSVGVIQTKLQYFRECEESLKRLNDLQDDNTYNENLSLKSIIKRKEQHEELLEQYKKINDFVSQMNNDALRKQDNTSISSENNMPAQYKELKALLVDSIGDLEQFKDIEKEITAEFDKGQLTVDRIKEILKEHGVDVEKETETVRQLTTLAQKRSHIQGDSEQHLKNQDATARKILDTQYKRAERQAAIQKGVKLATGGIQAASAAIGGIITATDQTKNAAERLNGAWQGVSGTVGGIANMLLPGSGILVQGIFSLVQGTLKLFGVWDDIEWAMMSVEERTQKLKNANAEMNKALSGSAKDIGSLESIKDEYKELSKLAGDYGKNIDNLTDQQKQRYWQLNDTFTQFNQSVITGYDDQGHAIAKNYQDLQATIELLKKEQIELAKTSFKTAYGSSSQALSHADTTLTTPKSQENARYNNTQAVALATSDALYSDIVNRNGIYNGEEHGRYANTPLQATVTSSDFAEWLSNVAESLQNQTEDVYNGTALITTNAKNLNQAFQIASTHFSEIQMNSDPELFMQAYEQMVSVLYEMGLLYRNKADISIEDYESGNYSDENLKFLTDIYTQMAGNLEQLQKAYQNSADTLQKLDTELKDQKFDFSTVLGVIKYGDQSFSEAYEALYTSKFYNSGIDNLIDEYVKKFTIDVNLAEGTFNAATQTARDHLGLANAGKEFIETLNQTFTETASSIDTAIKSLDFENIELDTDEGKEAIRKLINKVIDEVYGDKTLSEEQKAQLKPALQAMFKSMFPSLDELNIDLSDLGTGKSDSAFVQQVKTHKQTLEENIKKAIQSEFSVPIEIGTVGLSIAGTTRIDALGLDQIDFSAFNNQDLLLIQENFESFNWQHYISLITQGTQATDAFTQVFEDFKKQVEEIQELDFATFIKPDDIIKALNGTGKLTEAQEQYLTTMEAEIPVLREIALAEGRGSEQYIKALQQRRSLGYTIYQQNLEQQRQLAEIRKSDAEATIKFYETWQKFLGLDLDQNESYQQALQSKKEAEDDILQIDYEELRVQKQLSKLLQQQAATIADKKVAKQKQIISDVMGADSLSNTLEQNKDKPVALSGQDLSTALYYESIDSNLASIVQKQGQAGRFTKAYRQELQRAKIEQQGVAEAAEQTAEAIINESIASKNIEIGDKKDQLAKIQQSYNTAMSIVRQMGGSIQQFENSTWAQDQQLQMQNLTIQIEDGEQKVREYTLAIADLKQMLIDTSNVPFNIKTDSEGLFKTLQSVEQLTDAQWDYINSLMAEEPELAALADSAMGVYDPEFITMLRQLIAERMRNIDTIDEEYKKELELQKVKLQAAVTNKALDAHTRAAAQARIDEIDAEIAAMEKQAEQQGIVLNHRADAIAQGQKTYAKATSDATSTFKKQVSEVENLIKVLPKAQDALTALQEGDYDKITGDLSSVITLLQNKYPELYNLAQQLDFDRTSKEYIAAFSQYVHDRENILKAEIQDEIKLYEKRNEDLQKLIDQAPEKNPTLDKAGVEALQAEYQQQMLSNNQKLTELYAQRNGLLNDELRITDAIVDNFEKMLNSWKNGDNFDDTQLKEWNKSIDAILKQYPKLKDSSEMVKKSWLSGTHEYEQAVYRLTNAMHQLHKTQLEGQRDQKQAEYEDLLIKADVNTDQVEAKLAEILDVERQINIEAHIIEDNSFNYVAGEMQNLYDAAEKIGSGFKVAYKDIQDVVAAFPGILKEYKVLSDGTIQLNGDVVKQCVAGAKDIVEAEVTAQLARLDIAIETEKARQAVFEEAKQGYNQGEDIDIQKVKQIADQAGREAGEAQKTASIEKANQQGIAIEEILNQQKDTAVEIAGQAGTQIGQKAEEASATIDGQAQKAESSMSSAAQGVTATVGQEVGKQVAAVGSAYSQQVTVADSAGKAMSDIAVDTAQSEIDSHHKAAEQIVGYFKTTAQASALAGEVMSQNFAKAASSMAQSIYEMAQSAINNLKQVAAGTSSVANKEAVGASAIPDMNFVSHFGGGISTFSIEIAAPESIEPTYKADAHNIDADVTAANAAIADATASAVQQGAKEGTKEGASEGTKEGTAEGVKEGLRDTSAHDAAEDEWINRANENYNEPVQRPSNFDDSILGDISGNTSEGDTQGDNGYGKTVGQQLDELTQGSKDQQDRLEGERAEIQGKWNETNEKLDQIGKNTGGTGGSGGSSGSGKQPDHMQDFDGQIDQLHDINNEFTKINNQLTLLQTLQDGLEGSDLTENLQQQLELLEQQNELYANKLQLMEEEAQRQRASLQNLGVQFDEEGYVTNYLDFLREKQAAVNAQIAAYNAMDAAEQEAQKEVIEQLKKDYEETKKMLQDYENLILDTIPGLQLSIIQNENSQRKIQQKMHPKTDKKSSSSSGSEKDDTNDRIKRFHLKTDLIIDFTKAERDFNEFKKRIIKGLKDDDIAGSIDTLFEDLDTYYGTKGGKSQVEALTKHVNEIYRQAEKIMRGGKSKVYGQDMQKALNDLLSYNDKLMDSMESAQDVIQKLENAAIDAIDVVSKKLQQHSKYHEFMGNVIEHNIKLTKMLAGTKGNSGYNVLNREYRSRRGNLNNRMVEAREESAMWKEQMEYQQGLMKEADDKRRAAKKKGDKQALREARQEYDLAKKNMQAYANKWMETTEKLNGLVEQAVQNAQDRYTNYVSWAFAKIQKYWTNDMGFDRMNDQWQLVNRRADMYFDKVNRIAETQKIRSAYDSAVDASRDNIKAQQRLNKLREQELAYLEQKENLSQYDVDRANLLLSIEQKRIELENAQQSKTQLKLRRDSQGNYTYQYASDTSQVAGLQQELNDLQQNLYNLTKDAEKQSLENINSLTQEWVEKQIEIWNDPELMNDAKKREETLAMYAKHYQDLILEQTKQHEELKRLLYADTFDTLFKFQKQAAENNKKSVKNTQQAAKNTMSTLVSKNPKSKQSKEYYGISQEDKDRVTAFFQGLANSYNLDLSNFEHMTDTEKAQVEGLYRYAIDQYKKNTQTYKNMTTEQLTAMGEMMSGMATAYDLDLTAYATSRKDMTQAQKDECKNQDDAADGLFTTLAEYYKRNATDFTTAINGVQEPYAKAMAKLATTTQEAFNEKQETSITTYWNTGVKNMADKIADETGLKKSWSDAMDIMKDYADKHNPTAVLIGKATETGGTGFLGTKKSVELLNTASTTYKATLKSINTASGTDLPQSLAKYKNGINDVKGSVDALTGKNSHGALMTQFSTIFDKVNNLTKSKGRGSLVDLKTYISNLKKPAEQAAAKVKDLANQFTALWKALKNVPKNGNININVNNSGSSGSSGTTEKRSKTEEGKKKEQEEKQSKNKNDDDNYKYYLNGKEVGFWQRGFDGVGDTNYSTWQAEAVAYMFDSQFKGKSVEEIIDTLMDAWGDEPWSEADLMGYATGGYTGNWATTNGKLAILHQKQLVLNEQDTQNILDAVDIVRTMSDTLSRINTGELVSALNANSNMLLDQQVRIEANFPNVSNHLEIEEALNNLVNRASQYAFRNR